MWVDEMGAKIVHMICDGKTMNEIKSELDLDNYEFNRCFEHIRRNARIPRLKREIIKNGDNAIYNVNKWLEYEAERSRLRDSYVKSLFDFSEN